MAKPSRPRAPQRPEAVGELIPRVLEEVGLGATSTGVRLLRVWDDALGARFSPHCRPDGIRRGVIEARVRDSAWMQRLQLDKPRIVTRLRAALGEESFQDLRFRLGPLEEPTRPASRPAPRD